MTTNDDLLRELKKVNRGVSHVDKRLDTLNGQVAKNTKFRWFVSAIVAGVIVGVPLISNILENVKAAQ
ncbi:hypothetical protein KAR91_11055 [Candidatus Pacearchaeota archaeon]|nr:hypothetical protein [Candidatus Pacearchaeota archaeon]